MSCLPAKMIDVAARRLPFLAVLALLASGGCGAWDAPAAQRLWEPPEILALERELAAPWTPFVFRTRGMPEADDPDAEALVVLSGQLSEASGRRTIQETFPLEDVANGKALFADPEFAGAGAVFEGEALPLIFTGGVFIEGSAFPCRLEVSALLQVVSLEFVEDFDDALVALGLEQRKDAIVRQVVAQSQALYDGFNVQFVSGTGGLAERYVRVDIVGEDPNGAGLLGLDPTAGKDVGNLILDEVLGGLDPSAAENGTMGWGGVFASSILTFSPHWTKPGALADPAFDEVFGHFAPFLGGTPFHEGESEPERLRQVQTADRVLAHLLASTVTHEVGHCLGLPANLQAPDALHNQGDNPGWIMDAGEFRPFGERAGLAGYQAETLSPQDSAYLAEILPLDKDGWLP